MGRNSVQVLQGFKQAQGEVPEIAESLNVVIATVSMSFWSWGETIKVSVSMIDEGVEVYEIFRTPTWPTLMDSFQSFSIILKLVQ